MSQKQKLGQFYTTNYEYILQNFKIPEYVKVIVEPFAGEGDLINFIQNENIKNECYDIDPKKEFINKRDTLKNPPLYDNKFVLTNPPFLARNKSKDKSIFDLYKENDLYKCFIKSFINTNIQGGILIIPLNFWCSIRINDIKLRETFLKNFNIIQMNIFEERVFDDTSYTTCSFIFELKKKNIPMISCTIYPSKKNINICLNKTNNFTIGGEIYNLNKNKKIKVERATKSNEKSEGLTNILLKCIDDNIDSKIRLSIVKDIDRYIDNTPKLTARSYATLIITPKISLEKQQNIVEKFNIYLDEQREKYNSLFLTNYRESNSIARKRISFKLAFNIVNYTLSSL